MVKKKQQASQDQKTTKQRPATATANLVINKPALKDHCTSKQRPTTATVNHDIQLPPAPWRRDSKPRCSRSHKHRPRATVKPQSSKPSTPPTNLAPSTARAAQPVQPDSTIVHCKQDKRSETSRETHYKLDKRSETSSETYKPANVSRVTQESQPTRPNRHAETHIKNITVAAALRLDALLARAAVRGEEVRAAVDVRAAVRGEEARAAIEARAGVCGEEARAAVREEEARLGAIWTATDGQVSVVVELCSG